MSMFRSIFFVGVAENFRINFIFYEYYITFWYTSWPALLHIFWMARFDTSLLPLLTRSYEKQSERKLWASIHRLNISNSDKFRSSLKWTVTMVNGKIDFSIWKRWCWILNAPTSSTRPSSLTVHWNRILFDYWLDDWFHIVIFNEMFCFSLSFSLPLSLYLFISFSVHPFALSFFILKVMQCVLDSVLWSITYYSDFLDLRYRIKITETFWCE